MNNEEPTTFESALNYTLSKTNGYVESEWGASNFGITRTLLSTWKSDSAIPITRTTLKNLTREDAANLYLTKCWTVLRCGEITRPAMATAIFDMAAVFGTSISTVYVQRALRECEFLFISANGDMNTRTVNALNIVDLGLFINAFHKILSDTAFRITGKIPNSQGLHEEWQNRIDQILKLPGSIYA